MYSAADEAAIDYYLHSGIAIAEDYLIKLLLRLEYEHRVTPDVLDFLTGEVATAFVRGYRADAERGYGRRCEQLVHEAVVGN